MAHRFVLPVDDRTTLAVTRGVHALVAAYARRNDLTIAEATHYLILEALSIWWGVDVNRQ
jgi:hypothetical protein